jgi:hypothetical protein
MADVLSEIERQKRREQAQTWDANEKRVAERLAGKLDVELAHLGKIPKAIGDLQNTPTPVEQAHGANFIAWCADNGVRHCPAKPATVAAYLMENRTQHDLLLDTLAAISRLHDKFNLPNPCATATVRTVLELSTDNTPPRSWRQDEQQLWAFLPVEIRHIISRRELNRDKEVRRVQGELGNVNQELITLKKRLNAETKTEKPNGLGDSHPQLTG